MSILDKYKKLDYYDKKVIELGGLAFATFLIWLLTLRGLFDPILGIIMILSVLVYNIVAGKWFKNDHEKYYKKKKRLR